MNIDLEINGKKVSAEKGETILSLLNRNNIYIPTLCYLKDLNISGNCRLCVVEVEGYANLVPACSHPVSEWMKIYTHSPRVIKARKVLVELLLSKHPDDCLYCNKNTNCELQKLAFELDITSRRPNNYTLSLKKDRTTAALVLEPDKCILCSRCISICDQEQACEALNLIGKGANTYISPILEKNLNETNCVECGRCITVCPSGAIYDKSNLKEIQDIIFDTDTKVNAIINQTTALNFASFSNLKFNEAEHYLINTLKRMGFDKVYNYSTAVDSMLNTLADEIIERKKENGYASVFSSNCHSWIKFHDNFYPDSNHYISTAKSATKILSDDFANNDEKNILILPCVSTKSEIISNDLNIDFAINLRELNKLLNIYGQKSNIVDKSTFDAPYNIRSSSAILSEVSGGLCEAVIRQLYYKLNSKDLDIDKISALRSNKPIKTYEIKISNKTYKFAAVYGLANAKKIIKEIDELKQKFDFIEIMSCPNGCVGGSGRIYDISEEDTQDHIKAIYKIDNSESIKIIKN